MSKVRAKFYCSSVEHFQGEPKNYRFAAVYDDGIPENKRYAKYSPSGDLRIYVDNPGVHFEPGKYYYLDLTPVEVSEE